MSIVFRLNAFIQFKVLIFKVCLYNDINVDTLTVKV